MPYDRCALVNLGAHVAANTFVEPTLPEAARQRVAARAVELQALVSGRLDRASRGGGAHLALPLVSLDEIAGLLLVERDAGTYEAQDLSFSRSSLLSSARISRRCAFRKRSERQPTRFMKRPSVRRRVRPAFRR